MQRPLRYLAVLDVEAERTRDAIDALSLPLCRPARAMSGAFGTLSNPAAVRGLEIHWAELVGFIQRRIGDRALASDIAQDAYVRMARLPENMVILNPRAYLFTTAANLISDHARAAAAIPQRAGADLADGVADPAPAADHAMLSREKLAVLEGAIAALPPRMQQVFRLHRFDHLSYSEIAELLGISRNTVMVQISNALAACRSAIRDYDRADD